VAQNFQLMIRRPRHNQALFFIVERTTGRIIACRAMVALNARLRAFIVFAFWAASKRAATIGIPSMRIIGFSFLSCNSLIGTENIRAFGMKS
jgi:hypothetical protein